MNMEKKIKIKYKIEGKRGKNYGIEENKEKKKEEFNRKIRKRIDKKR
jgi:hypothetical protein